MKVIGISGSRRKKGNTYTLINEVLKGAELSGAGTELIFLGDYTIKPCVGCEGCKKTFKCIIKDDFLKIVSKIYMADGLVVGSPTYWYNVSADMKLFIDRCYSLILYPENDRSIWISAFEDKGKWAVPVAICEQETESMMGYTYDTIRKVMEDLSIRVSSGIKGFRAFEAGKVKEDRILMLEAKNAGEKLVKAIKLKQNGRELQ